jgi:hypothetical protein
MQFELDTRAFEVELERRLQRTKRAAGEVVADQARLFVRDCIKLTPPFDKQPLGESFNVQRRAGERAVLQDVGKVFVTLGGVDLGKAIAKRGIFESPDESNLATPFHFKKPDLAAKVAALVEKGDLAGVEAMARAVGLGISTVAEGPAPALHLERRDNAGVCGVALVRTWSPGRRRSKRMPWPLSNGLATRRLAG